MSVRATCPRGHTWEQDERVPAAPCPECGWVAPPAGNPHGEVSTLLQHEPTGRAGLQQAPPVLTAFEIVGELGRGGMGIVYKARWRPQHDRVVALKVIRKDRLAREEAVRRFRREAQAAARLNHPNIVQVFDSDHSGDTHYLVMEFVAGLTLERQVEEQGALPIDTACDYVRQTALGLQHAYEQALVHRDIKPSNLMIALNDDAGPAVVKILDMGVARVLQLSGVSPGESLSTLTQGGTVIGTADYIAPEQLEDPHGADIRADLYSLGCTFYYLLTGQVPFPGGSLISKLDKHRWQTPIAVDQVRPDVPAAVAALVRKLLAKTPGDRFQTPGELARALEELARTGYVGQGAASLEMRVLRRAPAHPSGVTALASSRDGLWLVSGGRDCLVRIWNAASGVPERNLATLMQEVRALAFDPSGGRLASAAGVSLRIWDRSGAELRRCAGHSDVIRALAFTTDGERLVSAAEDRTIRIWDLHSGREMLRLVRHQGGVTCLAVTADGSRVLSGSRDQTLRLWELRSGQELRCLEPRAGPVLALALAPDGKLAASAHFDTKLRLWDLRTGREVRRFPGHKQMPSAVSFTPDARHLVSASQDQTVRLWDIDTGCELACAAPHRGGISALTVVGDGRAAVSAGSDGELCWLELPLGEKPARGKPAPWRGDHI